MHLESSIFVLKNQFFINHCPEFIILNARDIHIIDFISIFFQHSCRLIHKSFPLLQFSDRSLTNFAVFYKHFSRESEAVLPPFCDRQISIFFTIRHSHPADVNPSSIFSLKTLRCIEIKSVIPKHVF